MMKIELCKSEVASTEFQLSLSPSPGRQFVQLCIGDDIIACYNDYGAPNEPYPIVIAVRPIVVRSLSEIENLVSRQAVPVLVELHLAARGVCKITAMISEIPVSCELRHLSLRVESHLIENSRNNIKRNSSASCFVLKLILAKLMKLIQFRHSIVVPVISLNISLAFFPSSLPGPFIRRRYFFGRSAKTARRSEQIIGASLPIIPVLWIPV